MPLHPELNGHIYHIEGNAAIYWIDEGLARHIADEATYHGVFGSNPDNEVFDLLGDITVGPDVAPGTILVRIADWSEIYLIDQKAKRYISSTNRKKYQLEGNVHSVPENVLISIPDGPSFA